MNKDRPRWGRARTIFDLRAQLDRCRNERNAFEHRTRELMIENQQLHRDLAWHRVHGWDEPE